MEGRLLLNVVIAQRTAILKLLASKDETLLVRRGRRSGRFHERHERRIYWIADRRLPAERFVAAFYSPDAHAARGQDSETHGAVVDFDEVVGVGKSVNRAAGRRKRMEARGELTTNLRPSPWARFSTL